MSGDALLRHWKIRNKKHFMLIKNPQDMPAFSEGKFFKFFFIIDLLNIYLECRVHETCVAQITEPT